MDNCQWSIVHRPKMNIPDIHIQTFPMFTPTGDYPNITMPNLGSRFLNRLSRIFSMQITMLTSRMGFEQVRRKTGLSKRKLCHPFKWVVVKHSASRCAVHDRPAALGKQNPYHWRWSQADSCKSTFGGRNGQRHA